MKKKKKRRWVRSVSRTAASQLLSSNDLDFIYSFSADCKSINQYFKPYGHMIAERKSAILIENYLLTFNNIGAIDIVSLILVLEIQPLSSVLEQF